VPPPLVPTPCPRAHDVGLASLSSFERRHGVGARVRTGLGQAHGVGVLAVYPVLVNVERLRTNLRLLAQAMQPTLQICTGICADFDDIVRRLPMAAPRSRRELELAGIRLSFSFSVARAGSPVHELTGNLPAIRFGTWRNAARRAKNREGHGGLRSYPTQAAAPP
jgi:hypothetical protein